MSTKQKKAPRKAPKVKKNAIPSVSRKPTVSVEPVEGLKFLRQGNPSMFVEAFKTFDGLKVGGPAMVLSPPEGSSLESFRANLSAALRKHLGVERLREYAKMRAMVDGRIAVQRIA